MSNVILAFSGTGNSRYVAKRIADATGDSVVDLNDMIKKGKLLSIGEEDSLVVVSPTYGWRLPRVVEQMIRNASFAGQKKIWFVMTCGSEIGHADKYNRKLCEEKDLTCMGTAQIVMPENYLAMFDVPDWKESAEIICKADPDIKAAVDLIRQGKVFPAPHVGAVDRIKSDIVNPVFYAAFVKADDFRVTDMCIGCGKCATVCPLNNIHLEGGRPVWGKNCTHCMGCICYCPKEAIEYGKKSASKPRYTCEKAAAWQKD